MQTVIYVGVCIAAGFSVAAVLIGTGMWVVRRALADPEVGQVSDDWVKGARYERTGGDR